MLGCGVVIVIECDVCKCVCLCDYVEIVGLEVYVDVWEGDVFDMVVELDGIVDMVFIDVWVDVYLKLFKQIECLLWLGLVVLVDNMYMVEDVV